MASLPPGYTLDTFEPYWANLDGDSRVDLIARSEFYPPDMGILPILKGLGSFHFNTRTIARQSLSTLVSGITKKLSSPVDSEVYRDGKNDAVLVSGPLYHQIAPDLPFAEVSFLLSALFSLGDTGAFFAFRVLYSRRVASDVIKKCIQEADEYQRLVFVDQYLQASPSVRLRFSPLFKFILETIKNRQPVIRFYASLFDRKRDPDPFLSNLKPALRDPRMIIDTEIASHSPTEKVMGLKALSMIQSRIPGRILVEALNQQEVKKMRLAVYHLIEDSSMGTYPELFDAVFQHFLSADPSEAVQAFKAMVVSGRQPVYKLLELIRKRRPEILPNIFIEVSLLSRISFFVIQDIALNKEAYLGENFDANLACIFGMIKKRPERVIRILKEYEERSVQGVQIDISGFIKTTSLLLKKEKLGIEKGFRAVAAGLEKPESDKPKGFLQAVLKDPLEKKLESFMAGSGGETQDFTGERIRNHSFAGLDNTGSPAFFIETVIQDCNLSSANISRACFNGAVFYNVNMTGAVFERICFDNAIFINVDARRARFEKCSFQGAEFCNCNFNDSNLSHALFTNAHIAKTTFARTNLACASFANAAISGVTFATADLTLADFSGVRARFSRFPSHIRFQIRNEGIDYNAREYQLGFKDLPDIDRSMVSDINMLVFCEFIHYGEEKFLSQNKLSLLTAFDIFKPLQADFFQLLPLLIHENLGLQDMGTPPQSTPCGIAEYHPSRETLALGEKYIGKKRLGQKSLQPPSIEGLFSMGSVGSLAQTAESDIDYWVCVDERNLDREGLGLLRRKLDSIETLAWDKFKIRVTFFLVDVLKARNNDFGGSTQESSGSAQSRLLKEEFYRTMILVAGKLPLWSVLPTTISLNYYNLIMDRITKISHSNRYIDLGDIHAIPVNEYFGASIWQMFKWLKSPFKSVIKMALLEKYIQAYGQETLLCNQYKNEWMNSGTHLKPGQNDSYIILLNTLIAFYNKQDDKRSASLLLTCFFLKLGLARPQEVDNSVFGMRRLLLEVSLAEWGWDLKKVYEIGRFRIWPYSAIHRLSMTIERYMVTKYTELKQRFDTQSVSSLMISEHDRIVLERKVNVVFQNKPHKIKQLLLISKGDRHFSRLHIKYLSSPGEQGRWGLVHKIPRQDKQVEETIMTADTIEEIGAWLINNRLYTDQTFLGLIPNPTQVSHENIEKLFRAMYTFFLPQMKQTVHFKLLRQQPKITRLFVSFNFYNGRHQNKVTDYAVVYLNSWGEMYLRYSKPGTSIQSVYKAGELILKGLSLKHFPEKTVFYTAGVGSKAPEYWG